MIWKLRLTLVSLTLSSLVLVPGCGDNKVKIAGKLTKNGQPMTVAKDTKVTLTFMPEGESKGQTYTAQFKQETGEYAIELPPGKYKTNCIIVEKNKFQDAIFAPPAMKEKTYELTKSQELNIEFPGK
jgi:hypothetical protein